MEQHLEGVVRAVFFFDTGSFPRQARAPEIKATSPGSLMKGESVEEGRVGKLQWPVSIR